MVTCRFNSFCCTKKGHQSTWVSVAWKGNQEQQVSCIFNLQRDFQQVQLFSLVHDPPHLPTRFFFLINWLHTNRYNSVMGTSNTITDLRTLEGLLSVCPPLSCGRLSGLHRGLNSWSLLHKRRSPPTGRLADTSVAHCDQFARHLAAKIACICHDLDSVLSLSKDAPSESAYPTLMHSFLLCNPKTWMRFLVLCSHWLAHLIKAGWEW